MLFCLMALRLSVLPIVGRIKYLRRHPTGLPYSAIIAIQRRRKIVAASHRFGVAQHCVAFTVGIAASYSEAAVRYCAGAQ